MLLLDLSIVYRLFFVFHVEMSTMMVLHPDDTSKSLILS